MQTEEANKRLAALARQLVDCTPVEVLDNGTESFIQMCQSAQKQLHLARPHWQGRLTLIVELGLKISDLRSNPPKPILPGVPVLDEPSSKVVGQKTIGSFGEANRDGEARESQVRVTGAAAAPDSRGVGQNQTIGGAIPIPTDQDDEPW